MNVEDHARELAAGILRHLREVEVHCPCGARPESLHTHPHVGGCPVDAAICAVTELQGLLDDSEEFPPVFETPEQEARYREAIEKIKADPKWQKMRKDIEDSQRITAADLAIVINAR